MVYQNPVYGIFNQPFIEFQLNRQHHNTQVIKSIDCADKLKDFLESIDEVESAYQNFAMEQCCIVVGNYMKKHRML